MNVLWYIVCSPSRPSFGCPPEPAISAHKMIGYPVKRFRQKTNQELVRYSRGRRRAGRFASPRQTPGATGLVRGGGKKASVWPFSPATLKAEQRPGGCSGYRSIAVTTREAVHGSGHSRLLRQKCFCPAVGSVAMRHSEEILRLLVGTQLPACGSCAVTGSARLATIRPLRPCCLHWSGFRGDAMAGGWTSAG